MTEFERSFLNIDVDLRSPRPHDALLDALYWYLAGELSEDELPSSDLLIAEARPLVQHLERRVHPV